MKRGDVTKLPKWAQWEIERLTRDLKGAEEKLAAGPEGSDTFADPYSTPRPLGRGPSIEFRVDDRWEKFNVRLENGGLEVMGGRSIYVLPRAGNVVRIELRDV